MAEFVDRQRKSREGNRPAINFTQRDDIREFAGSGIGRNYNRMMDLQSQKSPNLQDLKQARRQWNRYDKYNAAEMLGRTPMEAQDTFMKDTGTFRQANPRAYGTMYPFSNAAMKLGESGGLLGLGIRGLTGQLGDYYKSIMNKDGINAALDTDEAELENYANLTYGPHLEGIIEGPERSEVIRGPHDLIYNRGEGLDFETDPDQPYVEPDDYVEEDFGDFYIDENTLAGPRFDDSGREDFIRRQNEYVSPPPLGSADPQGDFASFNEYPTPDIGVEFGETDISPIIPYEGREFGLGQFMNEMPTSRKSDWEDYLEYVQRLGDMEGGHLEYDEWHDMMRRRR